MVGADQISNSASQIRTSTSHSRIWKESNLYRHDLHGIIYMIDKTEMNHISSQYL